jgi:hypothetical protein
MVSTCESSPFSLHDYTFNSQALCTAGSLLLLLTTNGGLFGAVSPTAGRYGFVIIGALCFLVGAWIDSELVDQ